MIVTTLSKCLIITTDIVIAAGSTSGGGIFTTGDPVILVATAKTGFSFVNWTVGGSEVSTDASYSFNAPVGDTTYIANFKPEIQETVTTGNLGIAFGYSIASESIEGSNYQPQTVTTGNKGLIISYDISAAFPASDYQRQIDTVGNLGLVVHKNMDGWQATMPKIIQKVKHVDILPNDVNIFDFTKMYNYFSYTLNNRNSFCSFKFSTNSDHIYVRFNPTFVVFQNIGLFIDGVFSQNITVTGNPQRKLISLSVGTKTIELVQGVTSRNNDDPIVWGTDILEVYVAKTATYTVIAPTNVAKKIVMVTDSIGVGAGCTEPTTDAFIRKFKLIDDIEVATIGAAWDTLYKDVAGNPILIAQTVSRIQNLFSNVTTDKILVITVGSNDFGQTSTTLYTQYYNNLLDAIHTADASIVIKLIGEFTRGPAGGSVELLLAPFRTAKATIASQRSGYCTYIDGPTLSPNYATHYPDGVHPDTYENNVIYTNLRPSLI